MKQDDYESLPTTSVAVNMSAGAIAGVLEHCVMYPLDSVKTRMQSLSTVSFSISSTFRNMIKSEGLLRPIRGITAVVAGAGPAHALYFGSYELTKEFLTKVTAYNQVNYVASGVVATLIHDAVSNPTEVIKQRMQMYNSKYKSVVRCMIDVYRKEGFKAFYRSYATQLVMNIPYQAVQFNTYEFFQNMLNHDRKYNPPVHVVAGGAAGACAAAITTPLDVVKTLLNTQETGKIKGMSEAVRQIYSMAGYNGFFRGTTARILYAMPATAICWSTYEFFKFYLCGLDHDQYKSSITGKSELRPREKPTAHLPGSILPDTALMESEKDVGKVPYVLPSATAEATTTPTTETIKPTNTSTGATSHTQTSVSTQSPPTPGPIKSVCELSTNVATPTLNLHTRHSEVKNPFDRGFSSP